MIFGGICLLTQLPRRIQRNMKLQNYNCPGTGNRSRDCFSILVQLTSNKHKFQFLTNSISHHPGCEVSYGYPFYFTFFKVSESTLPFRYPFRYPCTGIFLLFPQGRKANNVLSVKFKLCKLCIFNPQFYLWNKQSLPSDDFLLYE